ncbi:hypothetical protein AB1283_01000 [Bacillus sp. S13(2024)]|uniref:hypothetical protein n=1 Tax=Bacillus sp. S13(2024) TaxID=3162885 RepID=UPI003D1E9216
MVQKIDRLEIYLKSGHTVEVVCESWKFNIDNATGGYIGYEFKGLKKPTMVGFDVSQIAGYIVK